MDRFNARFNRMFNKILDYYEHWVRRALVRPGLTVLALSGLFVVSLAIYPLLGLALFPKTDAGQFTINLKVPTGTRIEVTDQYIAKVEDLIRHTVEAKDLKLIVSNIGVVPDFSALYTSNAGALYSDGPSAVERTPPPKQFRIHGPGSEQDGETVPGYSDILLERLDGGCHSECRHACAD